MKLYKLIAVIILAVATQQAHGQWKGDSTWKNQQKEPQVKLFRDKKFYWGFVFYQNFSNIKTSTDTITYFRKPSLGGGMRFEYYPIKNFGVSFGFNYMQRGAGIKLVDQYSGLGDPDSTYRTRLRFNTLDFPIQFIYRSRTVKERWKIHAGIGLAPVMNFKTNRIFNSVEDGFHLEQNQTSIYFKKDFDVNASLGIDIDVTGAAILQVHLVAGRGNSNVYNSQTMFGNATGKNNYFGLRVAALF